MPLGKEKTTVTSVSKKKPIEMAHSDGMVLSMGETTVVLLSKEKSTGMSLGNEKTSGVALGKEKTTRMVLTKGLTTVISFSKKKLAGMEPNKEKNTVISLSNEKTPGKAPDESPSVSRYTFQDLKLFTDDFSEENFIEETMFGKAYHGKMVKDEKVIHVTVKIWVDRDIYEVQPEDKVSRLKEELYLLEHNELNSHPNLVKLLGYCCDIEQVGVIYELRSLGTIYSLISKESINSFNWLRRIKAAVGLACALEFFHNSNHGDVGYLVRNIGPRHVMLDENYCPRIFDFGMLSGGLLPDMRFSKTERLQGCYGYYDPFHARGGYWDEYCDVFSYGGVLIGLLTNKLYEEEGMTFDDAPFADLFDWAEAALTANRVTNRFGWIKCCLVHESLREDKNYHHGDGYMITEIMMRCIHNCRSYRPTMKEVVQCLLKLRVVREHADFIGVRDLIHPSKKWKPVKKHSKDYFTDQYRRRFDNPLEKFGISMWYSSD